MKLKNWKKILLGTLMAGLVPSSAMTGAIPVRGVVEGFYGSPWTNGQREDIIKFCAAHNMNAYIYAPKDDPYHRAKWREPYPAKQLAGLRALAKEAEANGVRFIFAVSPGLDINFDGEAGARDRELMRQKFSAMHDAGVRDFAVFFDDIDNLDGRAQAEFLNWLEENFVAKHADVAPLITVPTQYFRRDMVADDGAAKEYTREFSAALSPNILVLYTGEAVVGDGLSSADWQRANDIYGRKLGVWWNYPVTDYMEEKLALGAIEKLPRDADIPAIFFNPMKYGEMSKIALATAADYANDAQNYDAASSWEKALAAEYGELAPAMRVFAEQSMHLENDWAKVGAPDGEKLREAMDALWASWPNGENAEQNWQNVFAQAKALEDAARKLRKELPKNKLAECKEQLEQAEMIAAADMVALDFLKSLRDDDGRAEKLLAELKKRRNAVVKKEKRAIVSEKTARAFIDEVLHYAENKK